MPKSESGVNDFLEGKRDFSEGECGARRWCGRGRGGAAPISSVGDTARVLPSPTGVTSAGRTARSTRHASVATPPRSTAREGGSASQARRGDPAPAIRLAGRAGVERRCAMGARPAWPRFDALALRRFGHLDERVHDFARLARRADHDGIQVDAHHLACGVQHHPGDRHRQFAEGLRGERRIAAHARAAAARCATWTAPAPRPARRTAAAAGAGPASPRRTCRRRRPPRPDRTPDRHGRRSSARGGRAPSRRR